MARNTGLKQQIPLDQERRSVEHNVRGSSNQSHAPRRIPRSQVGSHRSMVLPHTYRAGNPYYIGDVYEESQVRLRLSAPFSNEERLATPYLDYIDLLTDNGWPQLRYLGDWMRVTTAPPKWRHLDKKDMYERASRTNITLLEYRTNSDTRRHDITNIEQLASLLLHLSTDDQDVTARLFIVEDLSRDVIETLGSHFDIDPMFFRGHISDYNWYNTRDPWIELPDMDIVQRAQSHFQVRYAHPRYFRHPESYARARSQAGCFNVLRRVNKDGTCIRGVDIPGSDVGLVRSKMSFWVQPRRYIGIGTVTSILLVDPSITEGFPLWGGGNDFVPCPSMADWPRQRRAKGSTFEDAVYWLEQLSTEEADLIAQDPRILFLKPLCIVCSEWLTLVRYTNTRLSQLEWQIEDPHLRHTQEDLSVTLDMIHAWRRRLPIYRTFVSEALTAVIDRDQFAQATHNSLLVLEKDFKIILAELEKFHERAERTMSVVTAVMSIEEGKKALQHNRSLARLTYLAVTFVPLSFISSFFSMTDDVTKLGRTFWIYITVAVPVTLLALLVVRFSQVLVDFSHRVMRCLSRKNRRRSVTKWDN